MLGGGELVLDDDRVVDVAAERRDRVEGERRARPRARRPATRRRRAGRARRRLARRRAQVADERPGDAEQEQVEQARNRSRTTQTVEERSRPSAASPADLDDKDGVADSDPVALPERDSLDPPRVDPRAVRAAEVGETSVPRRPAMRAWWRDARPSRRTSPLSAAAADRQRRAVEHADVLAAVRPDDPERAAGALGRGTMKTAVSLVHGHARAPPSRRPPGSAGSSGPAIGSANRAVTRMSARSHGRIGEERRRVGGRPACSVARANARAPSASSDASDAVMSPKPSRSSGLRWTTNRFGTSVRSAVGEPLGLHRPLDPPLELDRLEAGPEQARGRPLEKAFEEPLDGGQGRHGRWRSLAEGPARAPVEPYRPDHPRHATGVPTAEGR